MGDAAFAQPFVVGNEELVIDVGYQRPLSEPLDIVEQSLIVELREALSLALLDDLHAELAQLGRGRNVRPYCLFQHRELHFHTSLDVFEFHSFDFLHHHTKGIVQTCGIGRADDRAAGEVFGIDIRASCKVDSAFLLRAFDFDKPFAALVEPPGAIEN